MQDTSKGYRVLESSEKSLFPGASRVGAADPKEKISVSVRVRRKTDGPAPTDMKALATTPHSRRKHLSREEYAASYGAAKADLDKVADFAKAHGLTVVESSGPRRTVVLAGTVEKMNSAFAVDLKRYQTASETYRSYEGKVSIPDDLVDLVESVHGFDNREIVRPMFRASVSGQATTPLTPPQVARLYSFPTNSAAGQTIAILEFGGGYKSSDITNYFANTVHMPAPTVVSVGVDGAANSFTGAGADTEVILDIDVAASVAPGAKIVVYFAPNTVQGFIDAITTAVHDATNRPSVISISWAGGESGWGSAIPHVSAALEEAAVVGVTVFVSSGDGGSGNPAQVLYPASDPWVTGCGGVTIQNVSGTTFTEVTWGGSGGGISNAFAKPAWQSWVNVPTSVNPVGHVGRGVPDISGDADPNSGYMLILNGAPTGPWGGTSAVAPFYAGMVAVLNASLDEPVGFLNQSLYSFNGTNVYRDVTVGSNGHYNSGPGWDACTGLGSVFGTTILTALEGVGLRNIVAVAPNADGRLEAFATGTDFALWHKWQVAPGGAWSAWASLGGVLTSDRAVGRNLDGRLEVFVRGTDDALWHIWQVTPGGAWSGWASLGGVITSDPYVSRNLDGRMEVFARGTDKALWHIWQTAPNGGWSAWSSLGGIITSDPIVAQNNDGRMEVFARGTDNALWHIWQTAPNSGWSAWSSLGGIITSIPSLFKNADGRLEAFVRGTDNALWHIWQTTPGGVWSGWGSLGGVITSDAYVSRNRDGRLEVFARGTDNALWHIWQTAPNGGWSGWGSLGGVITSDAAVAQNADGRMEVFARGTDNALWHIWQTAPNNGWSAWASLGGVIIAELVAGASGS
jgi:acylphosphatase